MTGGGRSGRALIARLMNEPGAADLPDQRAELASALIAPPDAAIMAVIGEVFAGTDLPDDAQKVALIVRVRNEVRHHWSEARDAFLAIGRALRAAEARLTREEFIRLRKGADRLFPFSDTVASQLRRIAEAVENGRIPEDRCPGSYSNAYQLVLLDDRQLQLAAERGLLRHDVTRAEVLRFRAQLRRAPPPAHRMAARQIASERARLVERRRALVAELLGIRRRLRQLGP